MRSSGCRTGTGPGSRHASSGPPGVQAHRRPARGGGAQAHPLGMRVHGARARRLLFGACFLRGRRRLRPCGRKGCARALRRQERSHHLLGGAPAWDCSGAEVAPGVPIHEGWGQGRHRLRVIRRCVERALVEDFQSSVLKSIEGGLRSPTSGRTSTRLSRGTGGATRARAGGGVASSTRPTCARAMRLGATSR